jgi:uncharacterized protein YerC
MTTREDFEIYEFLRNGQQWYGFKVDYIGIYSAPSKKQIEEILQKVKRQVRNKLAWVERENKKYYARLAEEERQRALSLKQAKEIENNIMHLLSEPTNNLTNREKQFRTLLIKRMIASGMTDAEIQDRTNASMYVIARIRSCLK